MMRMNSLPHGYRALVIGASGGIGAAFLDALRADPGCGAAIGLSRSADGLDLTDEAAVARHAQAVQARLAGAPLDLLLCATGALVLEGRRPEKSLRDIDPAAMAAQFALNAVGPALALKHFSPLLPRRGRALAGVLTARVGSIGDNRLGGWTGYRAAKAAANQVVRCAAIELKRTRPGAVLLALHPGTVRTALSAEWQDGRPTISAQESAARLLGILDAAQESGRFFAHDGGEVPW